MKLDIASLRVPPETAVSLSEWPSEMKPLYRSKKDYRDQLERQSEALDELQRRQAAAENHALLLIFQGMDASGKDGVIRHVFSGVNPQGCQVISFKQPSAEALRHDFLWRTTCRLPERGNIGIFNRSYYEEVLIVRVHPELLIPQGLSPEGAAAKTLWQDRYRSIVDLETHLHRNGTRILKFFLHLSRDEQRRRFLARIDNPEKHWKFHLADVQEREYWPRYIEAYEQCLGATSTAVAPWYVIPADDKKNARLMVSQVVADTLTSLNPTYPKSSAPRRRELQTIRRRLKA